MGKMSRQALNWEGKTAVPFLKRKDTLAQGSVDEDCTYIDQICAIGFNGSNLHLVLIGSVDTES